MHVRRPAADRSGLSTDRSAELTTGSSWPVYAARLNIESMTNPLLRRVIRAALEPGRDSRELVLSAGADISGLNYAFKDGIHTLYKFKPFATTFDEEVVRQILVDNEIYFARADQLNDKTELQIRHEITGDKSDPATRAVLLADLERLMREDSRPESFIQAQLKVLERIDLHRAEDEATRMSRERLRLEFPVFSLATRSTEVLHWKQYAADFTGLCIHLTRLRSIPPRSSLRLRWPVVSSTCPRGPLFRFHWTLRPLNSRAELV
jgi:hypothetical protein